MVEIEQKLLELEELLRFVPNECKGNSPEAIINRHKFLKIGTTIHSLLDELKSMAK